MARRECFLYAGIPRLAFFNGDGIQDFARGWWDKDSLVFKKDGLAVFQTHLRSTENGAKNNKSALFKLGLWWKQVRENDTNLLK